MKKEKALDGFLLAGIFVLPCEKYFYKQ